MGLTIHYRLTTELSRSGDVRSLVEGVRQFALDLPFKHVSDVKDFGDSDPESEDEEDRWLRIQAEEHLERDGRHYRVLSEANHRFLNMAR